MDAQGQAVAGGVDVGHHLVELAGLVAQHVQNRAEDFAFKLGKAVEFIRTRCEEAAVGGVFRQLHLVDQLRLAVHALGVRFQDLARVLVDHRAHVGAQQRRVAHAQFVHRARQHGDHLVGDVGLHVQHARRRAALAGRIEGRGHGVLHQLLGQGRRVSDKRVLAAGFGNQRGNRRLARGQGAVDHPGGFGRTRENHAGDARVLGQRRADGCTVAGHELQHVPGHAGLVQKLRGQESGEAGLLGGLGHHGIARGQRRGHLAQVDRQREVPGADAGEHALAVQPQFVRFTGGAGQLFRRAEQLARLHGVIAQEVHGLAHLAHRGSDGLAGFLHADRHEGAHALLQQVGRVFQDARAAGRRHLVPARLRGHGVGDGQFDGGGVGVDVLAHHFAAVGGVGHLHLLARGLGARHQRHGRHRGERGVHFAREGGKGVVVGEIGAHGIGPVFAGGPEQRARHGNAGMGLGFERRGHGHRVGDQVGGRQGFVGDAVDEAGIGAVFQQAPHQVGQQVFVRAHRRIHAAGHAQLVGRHHLGIQVVAHAVQLLVLELAGPALGVMVDRRDRMRVVRREHRIDRIRRRQHLPRAGQVAHVGVHLAGEHREARVTVGLGLLDLAVPVRALHQAHRDAPAAAAGQVDDVVNDVGRALLVGLHGQAVAFPAFQRSILVGAGNDVQAQLQALGFFGVDGEADALGLGQPGQFQHPRGQFGLHAGALGQFIARVQGGKLHRDRRRLEHVLERPAGADRADGIAVGLQVAVGVGLGEGRLAQHVERIQIVGRLALAAALQRLGDGAAHDELVAHDAHRLAHGQADRRFAGPADQATEGADGVAAGFVGQVDHAAGQHQAPGGGIDQHRTGPAHVLVPVGVAQLVPDQLVGRGPVGHPQQGLGHAHQQHAFLAGQVVLAHEGLHHARVGPAHPGAFDQAHGGGLHRGLLGGGQAGHFQQAGQVFGLVAVEGRGDPGAQIRRRAGQFRAQDRGHRGPWWSALAARERGF